MCNSKNNNYQRANPLPSMAEIDARRVLQPAGNRLPVVERSTRPELNRSFSFTNSPPRKPVVLNCTAKPNAIVSKKPNNSIDNTTSLFQDRSPGSLAVAQREQAAQMHEKRKMRIAHYGRTSSKPTRKVVPLDEPTTDPLDEKRCSFITPNSDPVYIAYHDQEWGVPVHDDRLLFELLVLSGAQVGLDWTTILKKRESFRAAFAGFDEEVVSRLTEKQMVLISDECGIDMARVRGVVDNSKCILEIKKAFGSLDRYLWGFVNNTPLSPQYRSPRKIPVKTSKAESISKDLLRRGFRFVGPTIIHSFMQASGLTNDHLVTCPRHSMCRSSTN